MANLQFRDVVKKYASTDQALGVPGGEVGGIPVPSAEDFATAAQGAKADTAVQPDDLGTAATMSPVEVVEDPAAQAALSGAFAPLGWIRSAVKPADESVASSTTLQDDDDLTFIVGANEVWSIHAVLYVTGPADGDMKINLAIPSGATRVIGIHATAINQLNQGNATIDTRFDTGTDNLLPGTPGEDRPSTQILTGVVWTGANAGSVTLRWAQLVSNATALTVRRGSHLVATRIA